jgi:hypothetical protein
MVGRITKKQTKEFQHEVRLLLGKEMKTPRLEGLTLLPLKKVFV